MSTFEVLQFPAVRTVLLLTTAFMIMEFSWTASEHISCKKEDRIDILRSFLLTMRSCVCTVIPVYTYTSVHLGGLGWDITWISYIFTTLAGVQVFTNLFAFPPFLRACGVRGGLIVMGCTLTGVFATAPLSNLALRAAQTKIAYTAVAITGLFGVLTNMFWGELCKKR